LSHQEQLRFVRTLASLRLWPYHGVVLVDCGTQGRENSTICPRRRKRRTRLGRLQLLTAPYKMAGQCTVSRHVHARPCSTATSRTRSNINMAMAIPPRQRPRRRRPARGHLSMPHKPIVPDRPTIYGSVTDVVSASAPPPRLA
jgi:hypothetical protein